MDEEKQIPIRMGGDDGTYLRVRYKFCPQNVSNQTVERTLVHSETDPRVGYVDHKLESGEVVTFKGQWKDDGETLQECVLVIGEDEVLCVPLNATLNHLQKSVD